MRAEGGGGIEFGVFNLGNWLSVNTNAFGTDPDLAPSSIALKTLSGGGIGLWDGNAGGGVSIVAGAIGTFNFGSAGIQMQTDAGFTLVGSPLTWEDGSTNAFVNFGPNGGLDFHAVNDLILNGDQASSGTSFLKLQNLPVADPGVSGAVWNDAGTLKISP